MTEALNKIISDLLAMRRDEAAGFMVMANSDDTMFEDCIRRLKELSASRPEGGAQQCPWAFYGTHMCRESFEAREQGLGTKKLRYPHGDPRNKPEDDPYEMSLRMNEG